LQIRAATLFVLFVRLKMTVTAQGISKSRKPLCPFPVPAALSLPRRIWFVEPFRVTARPKGPTAITAGAATPDTIKVAKEFRGDKSGNVFPPGLSG
jgi:hypothetical protein